jgi:hypothetical protein
MTISTTESLPRENAAYGGFLDAVGGIATVVLAIVGLAGVRTDMMVAIATVVFGAALLIEGGAILSDYALIIFPPGEKGGSVEEFGGSSLASVFLAGGAGIVLGVLGLLGIHAMILTAAAAIVFGSALILSANSVRNLHLLKRAAAPLTATTTTSGGQILANEMTSGTAGVQMLAGVAAIVLGILAVAGTNTVMLTLVALLVLGSALILTGSTLSWTVLSFMGGSQSAQKA